MKILVAHDGSEFADAALEDLQRDPSAQTLRSAGLRAEVLIRRGNPSDQILEEADTWGADCIFVGAKGTRGIDRLLLGSVSSAVSARAHCSVEIVRRQK